MTTHELILRNVPLAHWLAAGAARRFPAADPDDLRGAALLALCEAAGRYDPEAGVAFVWWASKRIRGALVDHLRYQTGSQLQRSTGQIVDAMPTDQATLAAQLAFDPWQQVMDRLVLYDALAQLPPRELAAFLAFHLYGIEAAELARQQGVSGARISQIIARARSRLRPAFATEGIADASS